MNDLGERLSKLAKALGIKEQELATIGNVGKKTFSSYKNGLASPRFDALARWTAELNVNANWLLIGEGPMFRGEAQAVDETVAPMATTPVEDPVVARAEKIAALMSRHGADDEDIREAIMASMKALTPQANEPRSIYGVHEPEKPHDTK